MKQAFYIFGFLLAVLMLPGGKTASGETGKACAPLAGSTVVEKDARKDMHAQIAVLSKELKNNNLLTPRRTLPTFTQSSSIKHFSGIQRILQHFRLRSGNIQAKVQERESYINTIHFSSLFCSMARHVFVMRKLLI